MELIIMILCLVIFVLSLYLFVSSKNSRRNLPPGSMGWPIIGETLELISTCQSGAPEKFFNDRMAKYSSEIFKTSLLGEPMVVLCGAAGNKFLFSNENKLVTAWLPRAFDKIAPSLAATSSAASHSLKLRKRLLASFLSPTALKKSVGVMDEVAQENIEASWQGKRQVSVYAAVKSYAFVTACKLLVGVEDPKQVEKLLKPFQVMMPGLFSVPIDLPGTPLNNAVKASKLIKKQLVNMIKRRRVESSTANCKDVMFCMATEADENGRLMNDDEIAETILGLLIASHETSSGAITFTMKYMAEHPHVYDAVLKEQREIAMGMEDGQVLKWEDLQRMKYSWNVACEVMRLCSPGQGGFREAITDFNYAGFFIPKGYKLYWNVNTTHKSSQYFPDPEKFDPLRFEGSGPTPYTYIPFGGGPRMCPGIEYARLQILVFMHHVVTRFRWDVLLPGEKILYTGIPKPENGFPVRICSHSVYDHLVK